jgi:peptidyl-prolyl cis-trans isomerase C
VKVSSTVLTIAAIALLSSVAFAQTTTAPATKPATTQASVPHVIATVGGTAIMSTQVESVLARFKGQIPEEQMMLAEMKITQGLIAQVIVHKFREKNKLVATDAEVAAFKKERLGPVAEKAGMTVDQFMVAQGVQEESLKDQVCLTKMRDENCSKAKVDSFIKANPDYFNGTTIKASHVLLACNSLASTSAQLAAKEKIDKLAADIQSGKITFEEAAKKFSACPSGAKGGDLGDFSFEKMDPLFAKVAFGLKTNEVSGVVHTSFGYHLIKATGRTPGTEAPSPVAADIAKRALQSEMDVKIMEMTLTDCPIVIVK